MERTFYASSLAPRTGRRPHSRDFPLQAQRNPQTACRHSSGRPQGFTRSRRWDQDPEFQSLPPVWSSPGQDPVEDGDQGTTLASPSSSSSTVGAYDAGLLLLPETVAASTAGPHAARLPFCPSHGILLPNCPASSPRVPSVYVLNASASSPLSVSSAVCPRVLFHNSRCSSSTAAVEVRSNRRSLFWKRGAICSGGLLTLR